jgi:hypothetical protein
MSEKVENFKTPRLPDGRVDFFTLIEEVFPDQIGVVSYVKGICKGYALDKAIETASIFKDKLESGVEELQLMDVIPEDIRPMDDIMTSKDIN